MGLDIEDFDALRCYLKEHEYIDADETVSFQRLAGGVSNRTVRIGWADGHGWVLKQGLAKLRVDLDWFSGPERVDVEAKALRWFNRVAPPGTTPSFVFADAANHLMAMEAIPPEHENWKSVLLSEHVVPDHFEQFGLLLGHMHRCSSESEAEVGRAFADTTYFESLRLEPYYRYTARTVPAAASFLNTLAQQSLRYKLSLVHGDFSPKNTLVYRGKLILLDYEVVHFGEAAFDVGFALTHFLSKAHHLPRERANLANAAMTFWQSYRKEIATLPWADALELRVVHHTLGCLLARVAGKSPLEYLTREERTRQLGVTMLLVGNPPMTVGDLIAEFVRGIGAYAED